MRTIKFRGKRIDNGEWVYGDLVRLPFDAGSWDEPPSRELVCWITNSGVLSHNLEEVNPETVGQYTGLQDKNGVEIYEGDIVKGKTDIFERLIGKVSYTGVCYVIDGVKKYSRIREELNGLYEVIGNIYENPELIEVSA